LILKNWRKFWKVDIKFDQWASNGHQRASSWSMSIKSFTSNIKISSNSTQIMRKQTKKLRNHQYFSFFLHFSVDRGQRWEKFSKIFKNFSSRERSPFRPCNTLCPYITLHIGMHPYLILIYSASSQNITCFNKC
jgi:hypothetical protein